MCQYDYDMTKYSDVILLAKEHIQVMQKSVIAIYWKNTYRQIDNKNDIQIIFLVKKMEEIDYGIV